MKRKKISCKIAREFSIVEVLGQMNFYPIRSSENEAWFLSPLRTESDASFKVSKRINRWYDHGLGKGGNVIDLVMNLRKCTVSESLEFLKKIDKSFSFQQPSIFENKTESKLKIEKICKLRNPSLLGYLRKRCIDIVIAQKHCKEIYYYYKNVKLQYDNVVMPEYNNVIKQYYGIAFLNNNGGYEIRNKYFKGCIGIKGITTIHRGTEVVNIFESFSDFLSYLSLAPDNNPDSYIITNSTALVKNCVKEIKDYSTVRTFFDNDESGRKATSLVKKNCESSFENMSSRYENFKDVNEYLIHLKKKVNT